MKPELKIAIWKIANAAIDMKDDKLNGQEFENLAETELMKVKNCFAPAVSVNEVTVCPRCKSKEVSVKPVTYDCYECGATWQT